MEKDNTYLIKQKYNLSNDNHIIILFLYKPIIGNKAYILYITLIVQDFVLILNTKYNLNNFLILLQMSHDEFLIAKNKLVTVGLLKILKYEKRKHYILKPQLPVSAIYFFKNKILSSNLFNIIGKDFFLIIKTKFIKNKKKCDLKINYLPKQLNNMSMTLDFVFIDKYLISKNINFNLYLPYREKIIKLANYYNVLTENLAIFIYKSIKLKENKLFFDYEIFQNFLSDYYQKTVLKNKINNKKIDFNINEENIINPINMLEVKINEMISIDPIEYLTLLRENSKPTPIEIEIIRELIINYSLKPGVINCLIEYVWFKNLRRIEKKYCEKIANTFYQLQIKTVYEAMKHLRSAFLKTQKNKFIKKNINIKSYELEEKIKKNDIVKSDYNIIYEQKCRKQNNKKINIKKLLDDLKNL